MIINSRKISNYVDINVEISNSKHDLGLHNKDDLFSFIKTLQSALEDLNLLYETID